MRFASRAIAIALSFVILSSPPTLQTWLGGDTRAFIVATILLFSLNAFIVLSWRDDAPCASSPSRIVTTIAAVAAALTSSWLIAAGCRAWLSQILMIPHDPQRADMLIVVQQGIERLLQGQNPYVIYHLPWDAPLPYGPVLWAPYVVPVLLRGDIRFVTVVGELFVPVACGIGAVVAAYRGRLAVSLGCLAMLAAMSLNPDLERFASIGHTPAYWPLVALFAWLVTRDRWYAAAFALGLLVVARTTMVTIVPVFLMTVWWRARPAFARAVTVMALTSALLFLPFAIWDARALLYALYGSYQNVMKNFVWVSTTWVQHTIGVTGVMLSHDFQRSVEGLQVVVMLGAYALAARAIQLGHRPLPWMGAALLAFSMTTLWPVTYIYFDVLLLLVSAALGEVTDMGRGRRTGPLLRLWGLTFAAAVVLVAVEAWMMIPANASIDVGTSASRLLLRSGFAGDEREADRTFAWVQGQHASMLVRRRSTRNAVIDLDCEPFLPTRTSEQRISAVLNGTPIGTRMLTGGWNRVLFAAPASTWQIGVNELELFMSSSASPLETGLGNDPRPLSVRIDGLIVRSH